MTPETLVFRPRAGSWVAQGLLTLLIAFNSLFWFFDPVPDLVRILGGVAVATWLFHLFRFAGARVELREDSVEVFGSSSRVRHPQQLQALSFVLLPLVAFDLVAWLLGPLPLWALRSALAVRIGLVLAYAWAFGAFQGGGSRSVKYSEVTIAPWEIRLGMTTILQMEIAGGTEFFSFPSWLNTVDQREVAGIVTARVKHARTLHQTHEAIPATATDAAHVRPQSSKLLG